jgi:hypothetical protein
MLLKNIRAGFLVLLAATLPTAGLVSKPAQNYTEGQIWTYKTRPQDEGSLIKINAVETDPRGQPIYHIAAINIKISSNAERQPLGHLPVSAQTLDASVTKLVKSDVDFPDGKDGIAEWRSANGGVFTITLAEIFDVVDQAINQQPPAAT